MMPMAAAALCYLEGLRPEAKAAVAFGSYGWGRGGPEAVDAALRRLEWNVLGEPLRARYRPTPEVLAQCQAVGRQLGQWASQFAVRAGTEAVSESCARSPSADNARGKNRTVLLGPKRLV